MKKTLENAQKLLEFAPKVGGVFSLSELSALFDISSQQMLWIKIKQFEEADLLKRYSRGIYVTQGFDPMILSAKVRTDSYVSFGSALAFYKLIGTESPYLVSCVVPSKASEYEGTVNLSYSQMSRNLFFGTKILENGVRIAIAEKAVLDTLYFYQHKKTFYFNVFQDINFSALSKETMNSYLKQYANPRFKAFVRNTVYGEL